MGIFIGIFSHVVLMLVHIGIIAVDITLFFLLVRCCATKWPRSIFVRFDAIGTTIVDPLFTITQKVGVPYQIWPLVLAIVLMTCRFGIVAAANSFLSKTL